MAIPFKELRPLLRPGAQLAYVVGEQASYLGVLIPTGELLAKNRRISGLYRNRHRPIPYPPGRLHQSGPERRSRRPTMGR